MRSRISLSGLVRIAITSSNELLLLLRYGIPFYRGEFRRSRLAAFPTPEFPKSDRRRILLGIGVFERRAVRVPANGPLDNPESVNGEIAVLS